MRKYRAVIRGAGDLASGVALRLYRAGFQIAMTDLANPTAVRRTVSFSEAVRCGTARVEEVEAVLAARAADAWNLCESGKIAILIDPSGECVSCLKPDLLVDAIMAKKNLGTTLDDAPVVIGVGPGFTAGVDCHAAVETKRGHSLGRALYNGTPIADTGIPGVIGGYAGERVIKAPADGIFHPLEEIGNMVEKGEQVGFLTALDFSGCAASDVQKMAVTCSVSGVLRGILPEGTPVIKGMKSGDVDPRGIPAYCFTVSDKALAVGGGVLEAAIHFLQRL